MSDTRELIAQAIANVHSPGIPWSARSPDARELFARMGDAATAVFCEEGRLRTMVRDRRCGASTCFEPAVNRCVEKVNWRTRRTLYRCEKHTETLDPLRKLYDVTPLRAKDKA